jgi:stage V sporulation protein G
MKIDVRIRKTKGDGATKAFAKVTIEDAFAIDDITVVDGKNGLFVQMPRKSYKQDGETKYKDVFHPVNAEARKELADAVMLAFNEAD